MSLALLGVLAACSAGPTAAGPAPTGGPAAGDPTCSAFAAYQGAPGTTVTFTTGDLNQPTSAPMSSTWAEFTRCTGIRIVNQVDASGSREPLMARITAGNAPDLTLVTQPGTLADLVHLEAGDQTDHPVPAPAAVGTNVDRYWNKAWRAYGSVDGVLYGAPFDAALKSLVWYSPRRFAQAGYEVPRTWSELTALSDRIAAEGRAKPWCGGIESGEATGWPATDWLEEVVLGMFGGDVYDEWVAHRLAFDSPEISAAMDVLAGWMHNPRWVNGGFGDVASIATVSFPEAGRHILEGDCMMLAQASFYAQQWEVFDRDATIGEDGDAFAFVLPPVDPDQPTTLVGSGDFVVAFSDRLEVRHAQEYLSSADWALRNSSVDGAVSANSGVPLSVYKDPISRLSAQLLTEPGATFRFDASDLMPTAVSEEEWRQLTAWFAEGASTKSVLRAIDTAWTDGSPPRT